MAASQSRGETNMTNSAATYVAIIFGIGIFLVIVAIGWRSVQNRRILRMQDANGHETIIIASEDDEISSVVTTEAPPVNEPVSSGVVGADTSEPPARSEFRQSVGKTTI
jgi:hypothetical protein